MGFRQMIKRRQNGWALSSLQWIVLWTGSLSAYAAEKQPNILLILADDVGVETIGCYGGQSYPTPNIDALARGGKRFLHCYSMPVCHPTRITLLTGKYPALLGRPRWGTFPPKFEQHTFAHRLEEAGYATAIAGKWQLALLKDQPDHPNRLGFDEYCLFGWHEGPRYYQPLIWQNGQILSNTEEKYGPDIYCDFLINFMTANKDKPFLAYYSMALCHDVTDDLPAPVPYGPGRDQYNSFAEMMHEMDTRVGRLVEALDRLGLRENTLILFTADNGTPSHSFISVVDGKYQTVPIVSRQNDNMVPGGKKLLTDGGTHVPLIANWPGIIEPDSVSASLVNMSDFAPTLVEIGRAPTINNKFTSGESFAPQLFRDDQPGRPWVYSERESELCWVRNQHWKLYSDRRLIDMTNDKMERRAFLYDEDSPTSAAARAVLGPALEQVTRRHNEFP